MGNNDGDGRGIGDDVPPRLSDDHAKLLLAGGAVGITVGVIMWSLHGGWKLPILSALAVWLYLEVLWTIHRPKWVEPPQ